MPRLSCICLARGEGFEPPVGCPTTVFKTVAFNHSTNPPFLVLGASEALLSAKRSIGVGMLFCQYLCSYLLRYRWLVSCKKDRGIRTFQAMRFWVLHEIPKAKNRFLSNALKLSHVVRVQVWYPNYRAPS